VHLQEKLNMLFTTQQVGFRPEDQHTSDRYLRIVSTPFDLIASKLKLATDIYTSPEDDEAANAIIASCAGASPVIHFHCGTTWQTKLWHEQGWIDLATRISADFPSTNILLSWGNPDEHTLVQRVAKGGGEHLVVLERLVLKQFVALLKKVDLVVGGDTGPVHLAATVNTPTVSFYRCTDGARNGPRGERHVIIQSPLECTTCLKKSCERNSECFRSITVDAMYNGVAGLLGRKAEMSLTDTKGMKVC
jgi:heptosyltransferase-1